MLVERVEMAPMHRVDEHHLVCEKTKHWKL